MVDERFKYTWLLTNSYQLLDGEKMSPKDRNPFRNIKDVEDLFEGLIRTALSEEDPLTPQGGVRFYISDSCSNQNGTDIRRPIDPALPPKPEPLIDINRDEKSGELKIIAEVPGFTKEDIKVEVVEGALKIQAEREGRRYLKEVPLEAEVDPAHSKVTYRNGVLEARLKVKEFKKVKGEGLTVA